MILPSGPERFWALVEKTESCWLWRGRIGTGGYGAYCDKLNYRAHRAAWMLTHGEIPAGMCICHHCDNPPCVNPAHLFLGTQLDNIRDAVKKNRHGWRAGKVRRLTLKPQLKAA